MKVSQKCGRCLAEFDVELGDENGPRVAFEAVEAWEQRHPCKGEASPADAWAPMTNAAEAARLRRTLPVMDEPFEPDSQQVFIDGSGLLWVFPSEGRSLVLDPATKRFDDSRAFRPPKVGRFGHVLGLRYVPPTGAGS